MYKKSFLKTKIKSHCNEVIEFCDKIFSKVVPNHTCLAVITLNYALKKDANCYKQVFLKECKCIEKKVTSKINYNLSACFSSSSGESDEA